MVLEDLTTDQEVEVLNWLEQFELSRPSKKLNRDFSDAVLLAEILKSIFPKMVDLHNYSGSNSTQLKFDNWVTLNRKVLRKINVDLGNDTMMKVAQADPKMIERVLYEVMKKSKLRLEVQLSESSNMSMDSGQCE